MFFVGHSTSAVGRIASRLRGTSLILIGVLLCVPAVVATRTAGAVEAAVGLGTADSFGVLAGAGVTNTGDSIINGDLGTCPTPAITGFPPGVVNGTTHANDAVACGAQADLTIAYNDAAGRAPTTTYGGPTDLAGQTLVGGVYKSPSSFANAGTLTLDGQANPDTVFIFQAGSTVITSPNSHVTLVNGAQACNVFWQVGSSATLGVSSTFVGTVLALTSITANTDSVIAGRLLARNGAVTLDANVVTAPHCAAPPTTTTTTPGSTTTTTAGSSSTTSSTVATTSTTAAPTATTNTTAAPILVPTPVTTAPSATPGTSTGTATATPPTVSPGQSTTVSGGGFAPSQPVQIALEGSTRAPTVTVADAQGRVSAAVIIPRTTRLGSQRVIVSGTGPNGEARRLFAALQVVSTGAPLAATGEPVNVLALVGMLCMALGIVIKVTYPERKQNMTTG